MPPARSPRPPPAPVAPATSERSPAIPPAAGEAPPDTAEAGVRVTEVGGGVVEDHGEVEREEATGAESVEEPEEEDPEEAEDEAEEGKGNEVDTVLTMGQGDGLTAAAESEKTATMEGGGEEEAIVTALKDGGGEDTVLESAVVEEPAKEDERQEQAEEELETQEEENLEDDAMEEDATVDDMNELPEEHEESGDGGSHGDSVSVGNAKDLEIFVGGLPKDCTQDDITVVFSQFGEIVSTKIIKPAAKKKNKCIAFIRYMSTEAAKKALAEFKDGVEVTGKRVKVSASQANNTLYLRNICKSWTKEQVVLALKSIGIEEFEMSLPDDPDTGGHRGISFLKFAAPDTAKGAFQQLQQPDALIHIGRSVIEYAQTTTESSQELAMKVKAVYLKHVPPSWDEENIKECCKSYGEIQEVKILKKSKKKSSFVEFSFRKSALACVEGINSAKIGAEVKLAASLARPRREIHLNKSAKGGFKANSGATSKDANSSIKKKDQKKEVMVKKSSHKLPKGDVSKLTSQLDAEVPQASNLYKGKRKAGKTENTTVNERLLKKARKNRDVLTKPSNRARHGGYATAAYAGESSGNMKRSVGRRYVTSNESHPIAGASSRSKPNARDLEPHAGYIPPVNHVRAPSNRVQITYVYDQPRAAPPDYHYIDDLPYAREIAAPPPGYSGYTSNPHYQGDYAYTYLPPPHLSRSDHPRSGAYSPPRRYY